MDFAELEVLESKKCLNRRESSGSFRLEAEANACKFGIFVSLG